MPGPIEADSRGSVREVSQWWFAALADRDAYVGLGYLGVSAAVSTLLWVAAVALLSASLPLVVILIGVPLTIGVHGIFWRMAHLERRRAGWLGATIGSPTPRPSAGGLSGLRDRFTDPVRWRVVGYFLLAPFVYWALLVLAIVSWGVPLYLLTLPLWGWAVGMGPLGMLVAPLAGAALLGGSPRATKFVTGLSVRFVRRFLGPDQVAEMQAQVDALSANRQEILSAVASERRRIERNLHDGVQQQLVAMGIEMSLAASKLNDDPEAARQLLADAQEKNRASIGELRTIGRGLHPAILDDRGLDAALSAVVASATVPISLHVDPDLECPIDSAETAYFVVSEAVVNIMKHSAARTGSIHVSQNDAGMQIVVNDDGHGGADPRRGTGLAGMEARVRGVDGRIDLTSPAGGPTRLVVEIPYG
ncbi:MAG: sensor histidine kinase [Acidimicrobiales bacterium]